MRILVIGATGAVGRPLVRQLREAGHEVIGTSRSSSKFDRLRVLGAEPVALDSLDASAVRSVLADTRPDAVIYEATSLTKLSDFKHFDRSFAGTNRLRSEGTDILVAAARESGVRRIVAQSYAPLRSISPPPKAMHETIAAMNHLEKAVTEAGGIALRYGSLYGDEGSALVPAVRAGKFPIVGNGAGISSFVHVEDAAAATVLALQHDGAAIYNIVDDDPVPMRVWLPELAKIIGANPPPHYPAFLARLFAGDAIVVMATESRAVSNTEAKRELGWTLKYPSWREGFVAAYGRQPAHAN